MHIFPGLMNINRLSILLLIVSSIISLTMPLLFINQLPDLVASHFNGSGEADGWTSKSSLMITYYSVVSIMISIFVIIVVLINKIPDNMINLPNKSYWLEKSRREESIESIRNYLSWIGIVSILFMVFVFSEIYSANIKRTYNIGDSVWIYLVILLISIIFIIIKISLRFNKIEKH